MSISKEDIIKLQTIISELKKDKDLVEEVKWHAKHPTFNQYFSLTDDMFRNSLFLFPASKQAPLDEFCFSQNDLLENVKEFFSMIDGYSKDEDSLLTKVEENMQCVHFNKNRIGFRSHCMYNRLTKQKKIETAYSGSMYDNRALIHEFTHAISARYSEQGKHRNRFLAEVCPFFCEYLAMNQFFPTKYPGLKHSIIFSETYQQHCRDNALIQTEIEYLLVKILADDMTLSEVLKTYSPLFEKDIDKSKIFAKNVLYKFENYGNSQEDKAQNGYTNKELVLGEFQYCLSNIIAFYMFENWTKNPQKTAGQFKTILSHDGEWNYDEICSSLDTDFQTIYNNFKENYPKHKDALYRQQQQILDNFSEQAR